MSTSEEMVTAYFTATTKDSRIPSASNDWTNSAHNSCFQDSSPMIDNTSNDMN